MKREAMPLAELTASEALIRSEKRQGWIFLFCLTLLVSRFSLFASYAWAVEEKKESTVEKMEWKEHFGGLPEGGTHVIRDSESWKNLWVRISEDQVPAIDFEKKMALAVFLGMKPTGGHSMHIEKIEKKKKKILVWIRQANPPKNAFVIQAFTSPYHIKVIDRSDLPVEFRKK